MEKKTRKQYSAEFKAKVIKEMLKEEKTVGQLATDGLRKKDAACFVSNVVVLLF